MTFNCCVPEYWRLLRAILSDDIAGRGIVLGGAVGAHGPWRSGDSPFATAATERIDLPAARVAVCENADLLHSGESGTSTDFGIACLIPKYAKFSSNNSTDVVLILTRLTFQGYKGNVIRVTLGLWLRRCCYLVRKIQW